MIQIGADIGQRKDPTAIAVSESAWRWAFGRRESHFTVRYIAREPLNTPYPQIASRLHDIKTKLRARENNVPLYVDATGVGIPVIDMMSAYFDDPIACFFTNGDVMEQNKRGDIRVGKAWFVSRLQALLQARRLHIAANKTNETEIAAMLDELRNYEIKINERAKDTYGAFRTGTHDDLVTALGLSTMWEPPDYDLDSKAMGDVYYAMKTSPDDGRRFNVS